MIEVTSVIDEMNRIKNMTEVVTVIIVQVELHQLDVEMNL